MFQSKHDISVISGKYTLNGVFTGNKIHRIFATVLQEKGLHLRRFEPKPVYL